MKKLAYRLILLALLVSGCASSEVSPSPSDRINATPPLQAQIANPASQNCIRQGGTLAIETRSDGGQFGVCYFEDNRQCEEWALMNGDCPVGGVKVTGYITPAGRYCAITGGSYAITGNSGADDEQGTCTFKNGAVCDAWDYFNGQCDPGATTALTIQPLIMELCDGQAQAMAHALEVLAGSKTTQPIFPTQSEAPLADWVNNASGTGCMATVTGTGELYESPSAVVNALGRMLIEQGWTEDPKLQADGPTGTSSGFRKGNQVSLVAATWQADDSANCPQDQPISACPVELAQQNYTITLNTGEEIPAE